MLSMHLTPELVRFAYARHGEIYNNQQREWRVPYHAQCWTRARRAFEEGSFDDFRWIYEELRRRWQVFRGAAGRRWSVEEAYRRLRELDQTWRRTSLSELDEANIEGCWQIVKAVENIKQNKYGPSVVAISKFLHFWNPGLFVIVDDAVVWRYVFEHSWVRAPMAHMRERLRAILPGQHPSQPDRACDLLSYVSILAWCAEVIRENPTIKTCFAEHVRTHAEGEAEGLPLEEYEAAAMEWLLLGLVEIPPEGVSL